MGKADKTNVMRILERAKLPFEAFEYSPELTEGVLIAEALHEDNDLVFKTLVTESDKKEHFVFVIPVAETLDLKAAAKAVGVKSVSMLKQKELLPLTGYIHGGCSPVGMKKPFKTVFHSSAKDKEFFYVSAGKVGRQIKVNPNALCEYIGAEFNDIILKGE
ncbi:MAG: Cys-tRNA(Pro) deacylase [Ruminococcaceae bacterium]|nr:Cys-tRNA(Pro) deacylase [Oscillospiraceae bacterium]MEE1074915.1 Cys-tRNA(Pro) deacylase [Acutalibacteraceae bacterium]